ncbi:MAG: peptidoglycan-binding domain-containing protein [Verrucomicrobia bacterium]|nr:peptidoglycan-binding domain-containing protein [Verrucomicrobiota bacterium]
MSLKTIALTVAAMGALAFPASARWGCGGPSLSFGFGFPLFPPPYYGYYGPPPVYYERVPVVVGREVRDTMLVDAQRALARRGYYRGVIDGEFGPQSHAALVQWQADNRLRPTGRLTPETLRLLGVR